MKNIFCSFLNPIKRNSAAEVVHTGVFSVRSVCYSATMDQIKAVLIDLSGTLHIEDTAIPGAQEALKRSSTCYK